MDLDNLATRQKSDEGSVMPLLHPITKEPLFGDGKDKNKPQTIKLLGRDGKKFKAKGLEVNRMFSTVEEMENARELHAAAVTVGGDVFLGGKWVELSQDNAAEIYAERPWMMDQIDAWALDLTNFFPQTSKP